nr:hypothetical protein CFP56_56534 [Quercus suber]
MCQTEYSSDLGDLSSDKRSAHRRGQQIDSLLKRASSQRRTHPSELRRTCLTHLVAFDINDSFPIEAHLRVVAIVRKDRG